jgi:hypothetical protein
MVTVLALACTACADLTGIQTFAKMAPDPAAVQGLTRIYVQEPDLREDIKLLGDDPPNPDLAAQDKLRAEQAVAIQGLDKALCEYMQALGALAAGDVVQSTSNVKGVTTGLTSLQKAEPALGLTAGKVSIITEFIQSIADLAENGYRNAKLVDIISRSDPAFQQIISLQRDIVTKAIKPSIAEIQTSLNQHVNLTTPNLRTDVLKFMGEDLDTWGKAATQPHAKLPPGYENRNPTYGALGAADAHAARYLLKKSLEADQATLTVQAAAADAYVKALQSIGTAHTKLVKRGKDLLTKATVTEIQPLAQEVHKDYQDIQGLESTSPAKH